MDIALSDQEVFQCNTCKRRSTIRIGSYYYHSTLSLKVHICILYFFSNGSTVSECFKFLEAKCTTKTIIQWHSYYRDIMTTYLAANPVNFNTLVHVNETAIGGHRKYNRGDY